MSIGEVLGEVAPFSRLAPAARAHLAARCTEKWYARGETVFHEGAQADAVWLVEAGRVHLMKYLVSGQVSTSCILTDGEMFCCLPAMDRKTYPADAVAAMDSTLVRIPLTEFSRLLETHPEFSREALCQFCSRLRQVETRGCMLFDPVEKRIARVLLTLRKKFGDTIPLTRQEIAELAGTTVETAIRTISHWQGEKIVSSTRGRLTVKAAARLEQLLQ